MYRVTQYDPRDRDDRGAYHGPLDTIATPDVVSDYLTALRHFLDERSVTTLTVRDPEWYGEDPDLRPLDPDGPVARVLGTHLERWVDGSVLPVADAVALAGRMLRCELWCRLEHGSGVAVHAGDEMYMYITVDAPCPDAERVTAALGLFPEWMNRSPYERDPDDVDEGLRTVDATFWADVDALTRWCGAVVLLEEAAWPRYWTLTAGGTPPAVRAGARVSVWPQWPLPLVRTSRARAAVLRLVDHALRQDAGRLLRRRPDVQVAEGLVRRGTPFPPDLYDEQPVLRGIVPDPAGVVSARWPAWEVG